MKQYLSFLICVLLLGVINLPAAPPSIKTKLIRYTEKSRPNASAFQNQGLPLKSKRLSNSGGPIVLIHDETLPDSVKTALNAAKTLWEAKLPLKQPVLEAKFAPLDGGIAMIADVSYCENSTSYLGGCPGALAAQLINSQYGDGGTYDGYITFNSDIDWNCSFSKNAKAEYNLPTIALRGIARCLGVGSSVTKVENNKYIYAFGWPTYFDKLLFSNNKQLTNLSEQSTEMTAFVTSNNVYVRTKTQNHKIYAPATFVQDLSLCYFEDKNSLMSYALGEGNVTLSIDGKTEDVLRTIGWNLPLSGLKIKSNSIADDGIGSSYSAHTFSLDKGTKGVSNFNWRFLLRDKNGNYKQVSSDTKSDFSIAKIANPGNYMVNVNGDLEGRIECEYTMDGKRYSASPFMLYLELKPTILSISDITVVKTGQYGFSLLFNVHYAGADYVSVDVEEEFNTTLRNYRVDEPYIAHVKTGNITNLEYSWVTITVENKYGTTSETLEYAPTSGTTTGVDTMDNSSVKQIQLYDIGGRNVFTGSPTEFSLLTLPQGIYIKKEIFENGNPSISKIHIQ